MGVPSKNFCSQGCSGAWSAKNKYWLPFILILCVFLIIFAGMPKEFSNYRDGVLMNVELMRPLFNT